MIHESKNNYLCIMHLPVSFTTPFSWAIVIIIPFFMRMHITLTVHGSRASFPRAIAMRSAVIITFKIKWNYGKRGQSALGSFYTIKTQAPFLPISTPLLSPICSPYNLSSSSGYPLGGPAIS